MHGRGLALIGEEGFAVIGCRQVEGVVQEVVAALDIGRLDGRVLHGALRLGQAGKRMGEAAVIGIAARGRHVEPRRGGSCCSSDRHRVGGRADAAMPIGDRIMEDIGRALAARQSGERAARRIGGGAVAVEDHRALGAGEVDPGDGQRVAKIGIDRIGEQIDGDGVGGIGLRRLVGGGDRLLDAVDRHRLGCCAGAAMSVRDRVVEDIGRGLTARQRGEGGTGRFSDGAIAVEDDRPLGAGKVDPGDGQRLAAIGVDRIGEEVDRDGVSGIGLRRLVGRGDRLLDAVNGNRLGGHAGAAMPV